MAEAKDDPVEMVRKLAESYRGIKFGSGVVGKTSYATMAVLGMWALILFRLAENWWLNATLLLVGGIATKIYHWWVCRTQDFAEKNPGLALLEGTELVEYQKWEAEVKGMPAPKGKLISNPHASPREIPDSRAK